MGSSPLTAFHDQTRVDRIIYLFEEADTDDEVQELFRLIEEHKRHLKSQYENAPTQDHLDKINEWNQLLDQANELLRIDMDDCFIESPSGRYQED